jgi:acyl-CoA synthetase (AMP-forming)/AMP-acid ligase II
MSAAPWRLRGDALAARGEAVALRSRAASVSYGELARRAASVWRSLARMGVLPGDPVALVSSGRGHDEAVALSGILTCGAVAVPFDAAAPPRRLAAIAAARGCVAIVLDEAAIKLADGVDAEVGARLGRVILDEGGNVVGTAPGSIAASPPRDASLACILHTSGSTGAPKPVPISWEGLDAFTGWTVELLGLGPGDRVLRVAELVFDLAWFDHLATLRAGATLLTMPRRDLAAGRSLAGALGDLAPTVIYGVPSLFMKLTAALPAGAALSRPPRAVMFAGEVFPPRELCRFAEIAPGAELFNLYGPTETNVCTFHRVDRAALDGERETPIGIACPYARCVLVTAEGRQGGAEAVEPLPRTEIEGAGVGELWAYGPTTIGGGPHATGDRVERGADGLFYFRGRLDRMVKIRGYRVEPSEVEGTLSAHAAVRQAAVLAVEDPRLGKTLRAFVSLRAEATERELRTYLSERLPPYMVPERIAMVEELPRTTTGKIDYAALG